MFYLLYNNGLKTKTTSIVLILILFLIVQLDISCSIPIDYKIDHVVQNDQQEMKPIGDRVMLQSFYWMVPDNGKWWAMLEEHIPEFVGTGFDALWIPPMSKTDFGDAASNGYEPFDYYDLGEYNQKGRIRTRFGTRTELENLINEANNYGVAIVADIVMNHNVGGEAEYNPFVDTFTETNFMNIASGKFPRNYTHFYPNEYGSNDNFAFANFPDLCHQHPYVQSELINWAKWLRDEVGFDGWRFDVALGIDADMLGDWMGNVSGWGVAEYWGGNFASLLQYLDDSNNTVNAFDFFLMYELRGMAINNGKYNMQNLRNAGLLWNGRKEQAVTFVVNHDTVRNPDVNIDQNKHMAYAYILSHEGYPTVFWGDYFDLDLQPHIKALMKIRNNYAKGDTTILYTSQDLYVVQRDGDPGIILGLNDNPIQSKEVSINTKWSNTILHDLTGQAPNATVDVDGKTTIKIPPMGYAIFSDSEDIVKVPEIPSLRRPIIPALINYGIITIDGKLDEAWGNPLYVDRLWDAGGNQRDLTNLYIKHDNTNLYIGIGFGKKIWDEGAIHYGLALDVKEGGGSEDPWGHQDIRWSYHSSLPDYIYYMETNPDIETWGEIHKAKKYVFDSDNGWDVGTDLNASDYDSNSILGFAELKIPLTDIDLASGGNISLMVFSTVNGKLGAVDSIPHDEFTDGHGDIVSWLTLPDPLNLSINITTSQLPTAHESSKQGSLSIFVVIFSVLLVGLMTSRKRKH